ncbi:hypothetical protein CK203_065543 [Vitis vinifera]|uniref:Uncharacterized protein n=1 Tax=Vitis vinifera TaxID=29760 RepID=A0A438G8N6_VITVI|nr:hypothetical protein CK203_065543 [Vitis vinifera]
MEGYKAFGVRLQQKVNFPDCDNWVEVGCALMRRLGQKGVVTIVPFSDRKVVGVEEVRRGREMVSQPKRILCLTRGHVVEDELREIDQRLMEVLLLGSCWFLPSSLSILNSNKQRLGPAGLEQGLRDERGEVWFKEVVEYSFSPSFGHQQGFRSRSEPLTHEKPSSNCEAPPKEDAFKGEHGWYEDSVRVVSLVVDHQGSERGVREKASLSRGDAVLRKPSNDEDREGYKGLVGF